MIQGLEYVWISLKFKAIAYWFVLCLWYEQVKREIKEKKGE